MVTSDIAFYTVGNLPESAKPQMIENIRNIVIQADVIKRVEKPYLFVFVDFVYGYDTSR